MRPIEEAWRDDDRREFDRRFHAAAAILKRHRRDKILVAAAAAYRLRFELFMETEARKMTHSFRDVSGPERADLIAAIRAAGIDDRDIFDLVENGWGVSVSEQLTAHLKGL